MTITKNFSFCENIVLHLFQLNFRLLKRNELAVFDRFCPFQFKKETCSLYKNCKNDNLYKHTFAAEAVS